MEDDAGIREGLTELLEDEGYSVETASNGIEALTLLAQSSPAAILLDLMMPSMDGVEFLKVLRRERPELAGQLPIFLLTAAGDKATQVTGVQSVIRKPIDVDSLLSHLEAV